MSVLIPVSVGELLDKLSILRIKMDKISDRSKLQNVTKELLVLEEAAERYDSTEVQELLGALSVVNSNLWMIEDQIRECERKGDFGATFIDLARQVYQWNDRRAALKKEMNLLTGSELVEEKSYAKY